MLLYNQVKKFPERTYCLCSILYAEPGSIPEIDTVCYDTVMGIKDDEWENRISFDVLIDTPSNIKGILGYSHTILGFSPQDYIGAYFFTFYQNDVTSDETLNFIVLNLYARYGRFLSALESMKHIQSLIIDGESSTEYLDKLF